MDADNLSAVRKLHTDVGNAITLIPIPDDPDMTPGERRTLYALTGDLLRAEARLARLAERKATRED
jgi:hypothetical protein